MAAKVFNRSLIWIQGSTSRKFLTHLKLSGCGWKKGETPGFLSPGNHWEEGAWAFLFSGYHRGRPLSLKIPARELAEGRNHVGGALGGVSERR